MTGRRAHQELSVCFIRFMGVYDGCTSNDNCSSDRKKRLFEVAEARQESHGGSQPQADEALNCERWCLKQGGSERRIAKSGHRVSELNAL